MDPQVDHRFLNEIEALKGNCAGEHVLRLVAALRAAWRERDLWREEANRRAVNEHGYSQSLTIALDRATRAEFNLERLKKWHEASTIKNLLAVREAARKAYRSWADDWGESMAESMNALRRALDASRSP